MLITHKVSEEKQKEIYFSQILFFCFFGFFFNPQKHVRISTHMASFVNLEMKMTSHFPDVTGVALP